MSALVEKISAQYPHSQVIPTKVMSIGKVEKVAGKDDRVVATMSPSDTESFSKASDVDSDIHNKHEGARQEKQL